MIHLFICNLNNNNDCIKITEDQHGHYTDMLGTALLLKHRFIYY